MTHETPVWITGVGAATPLGSDYASIAGAETNADRDFNAKDKPIRGPAFANSTG